MTISNFAITGYFNPAAPPTVAGSIVGLLYWHEGLAAWAQLGGTPPTAPLGKAFHLAVQWLNQSAEAICGHVALTITKPNGSKVAPNDVLNQNNWTAPGNGWAVQFEPVVLDQAGTYRANVMLSTMGQTLSSVELNVAITTVPDVGFSFGTPSAQLGTCPFYHTPCLSRFTCNLHNPASVAITRTISLKYIWYSKDYDKWWGPTIVTGYEPSGEYERGNRLWRMIEWIKRITLSPKETYQYVYDGIYGEVYDGIYYQWSGQRLASDPYHYPSGVDYYFYLEDDLGNKSTEAHLRV